MTPTSRTTFQSTSQRGMDFFLRDGIIRITSLFQAGEEAVTLDLIPLILVVSEEGRLEEEMYLTSFLWEEAKHVEVFNHFQGPSYRRMFHEELPKSLQRLHDDRSPV